MDDKRELTDAQLDELAKRLFFKVEHLDPEVDGDECWQAHGASAAYHACVWASLEEGTRDIWRYGAQEVIETAVALGLIELK